MKTREKEQYISQLKGERFEVIREYEEECPYSSHVNNIIPYSYYNENIFCDEDFYLYRAVLYTYAGQYEKAIRVS